MILGFLGARYLEMLEVWVLPRAFRVARPTLDLLLLLQNMCVLVSFCSQTELKLIYKLITRKYGGPQAGVVQGGCAVVWLHRQ